MFLEQFRFPNSEDEFDFRMEIKRTCYDSFYPFQVLSKHYFTQIDFEPVTILCGGNGCGKTTALNVIAQKLGLSRTTPYNKSNFFDDYVNMCKVYLPRNIPRESCIITSDDVFDYMIDLRLMNDGIDRKREELFGDYLESKYSRFQFQSMADLEQLKKVNMAKGKTQSKFVRSNLMDNVREKSNGESAFAYFIEKIKDNGLYILDEPENSLSTERQLELVDFLHHCARYFGCQFVISTHSPFILSIPDAKIYDLDEEVVDVKKWTELKNVRVTYDFFKKHETQFCPGSE